MPQTPEAPIVIVEDDAATAEIFGMDLKEAGYQVQLLSTAEAALAFCEHATPRAAIIDLHLPMTDGVELIRRMRAKDELASTPIVLVTGDYLLDDAIARQLRTLGARVYFKPIWSEELVALVREMTSSSGST